MSKLRSDQIYWWTPTTVGCVISTDNPLSGSTAIAKILGPVPAGSSVPKGSSATHLYSTEEREN